nr:hypothetical protein [Salinigranum rubrum]
MIGVDDQRARTPLGEHDVRVRVVPARLEMLDVGFESGDAMRVDPSKIRTHERLCDDFSVWRSETCTREDVLGELFQCLRFESQCS